MEVQRIPIGLLKPGKWQPRKLFNEKGIGELAESIKAAGGLIQPVAVRPLSKTPDIDGYEIIAGERRVRACRQLGEETVPCLLKTGLSDVQVAALALSENIAREDLSPVEVGEAISRMRKEFNLTQSELSDVIGATRDQISRLEGVSRLPAEIQEMIHRGDLKLGHAKCLMSGRLTRQEKIRLAQMCVEQQWTVANLAVMCRTKKPSHEQDVQMLDHLARSFGERIQAECKLTKRAGNEYVLEIKSSAPQVMSGLMEKLAAMTACTAGDEESVRITISGPLGAFDFIGQTSN